MVRTTSFVRRSFRAGKPGEDVGGDEVVCRQFLDSVACPDVEGAQRLALRRGCDVHWSSKKAGPEAGMFRQGQVSVGHQCELMTGLD
jgi:hypothetical protein